MYSFILEEKCVRGDQLLNSQVTAYYCIHMVSVHIVRNMKMRYLPLCHSWTGHRAYIRTNPDGSLL